MVTGADIRCTSQVVAGATLIPVVALDEALNSGDKVRFGNLVATLTANASVGAQVLTVSALDGGLTPGVIGNLVVNISGYTLQWRLKKRNNDPDTAILLTKTPTITSAALGVYQYALARGDTIDGSGNPLIGPGSYWYILSRIDSGVHIPLSFGPAVFYRDGAA